MQMTTKAVVASDQEMIDRKERPAVYLAAGLSLVAALIHLWAAPEHLEEWWAYGVFFLVAALCQGFLSFLIVRWPESKTISLAGIVCNLSIAAMYVVSRTWGMPLGPDWVPFSPYVAHLEDPEVLGMFSTAAEVGIVFALVMLLDGAYRRAVINALLFLGVLIWALRLTGILP
ncbi:MAG: hypothetical protein WA939_24775 [Nodosilinea sp.]